MADLLLWLFLFVGAGAWWHCGIMVGFVVQAVFITLLMLFTFAEGVTGDRSVTPLRGCFGLLGIIGSFVGIIVWCCQAMPQ